MKKHVILIIALVSSASGFFQEPVTKEPIIMGETLEFFSKELMENRKLNIYLPVGYKGDETRSYPVIYLLDGSVDEGFTYISGLAQFCATRLKTMPESIVVGVVNVDRKRDFTYPSRNDKDINQFPASGKSNRFVDFMSEELLPLIEEKYRTNGQRSIIGQAFGGLLAAEILFTRSKLFHNYMLISPSLWWDDSLLVRTNTANITDNTRIYVAVWNRDALSLKATAKLMSKLRLTNKLLPEKSLLLTYDIIDIHDHGNIINTAMYNAFKTLKQ